MLTRLKISIYKREQIFSNIVKRRSKINTIWTEDNLDRGKFGFLTEVIFGPESIKTLDNFDRGQFGTRSLWPRSIWTEDNLGQ